MCAEITYGLLGCDVMFHQRLEDPAGLRCCRLTQLEQKLRPASDPSSVTPWGSQFVAGARAMYLQLAAAAYILYALRVEENGETAMAVANTTVHKQVNIQRLKYIGRPEFAVRQWVM